MSVTLVVHWFINAIKYTIPCLPFAFTKHSTFYVSRLFPDYPVQMKRLCATLNQQQKLSQCRVHARDFNSRMAQG